MKPWRVKIDLLTDIQGKLHITTSILSQKEALTGDYTPWRTTVKEFSTLKLVYLV